MRFLFIGNTSKLSCLKILNSCNARMLLLKDILANLTIGLQQNLEIYLQPNNSGAFAMSLPLDGPG